MSPIVSKGIEQITAQTNLKTGLKHGNDMNRAKEMFTLLHKAGEVLSRDEIEALARTKGWQPEDAKELGELGERIGNGRRVRITDGPWWNQDIVKKWQAEHRKKA